MQNIELANHKKIVTQALSYNDAQTAINSMHYIIALEGANSTYKDSLAITYYRTGNYVSSHLLVKELLTSKPDNTQLLEMNAVSLQSLGATKDAIAAYEILFSKTKNMVHGYQLAMLQYRIKRLAEAQATIVQTLQCEDVENAYLQFSIDKNQNQNVPLKVAAYNLQGLIAFELKDNAAAKQAFDKALEIMPEFTVATQNANAVVVAMQNEQKVKRQSKKE
ncbi:tetratricopeptide repeat protein [Gaetbulibacter jejuensis]|uniref:tetratricopeptide repeat protein n=1 Tax=Gaetbulibacter jejuensis TaxID=584607 RepID=UPI00300B0A7B